MRRFVFAAAILFVALPSAAMPVGDYIAHLQSIDVALRTNRAADAQEEARTLLHAVIEAPGGDFTADSSLLNTVIAGRAGVQTRIAVVITELQKAAPNAAPPPDSKLLDQLRRDESGGELTKGGEVSQPEIDDDSLIVRAAQALEKIINWISDKLEKFGEWLQRFWPKASIQESEGSSVKTRWVVGALVVAIVIVLSMLAIEVIRRSKRRAAAPVIASDPVASKRDEDPLSRGATEWERYATQLAAAGRVREAIRAWYHAVLVTCYGAGILHFRKGRTNWEYIAALSPELAWRGDFVRLTRRFEEEWYGRDKSTSEALEECTAHAKRILDALRSRREAAA